MKKQVTLLLAEDEDELRDILSAELTQAGFIVVQADNGKLALDVCMHKPIDIIVSDISMPGFSGFTLLKKLRIIGKDHIPVIFMTAYASHVFDEFAELDSVDVLSKPFEPSALLDKIKSSLEEIQEHEDEMAS